MIQICRYQAPQFPWAEKDCNQSLDGQGYWPSMEKYWIVGLERLHWEGEESCGSGIGIAIGGQEAEVCDAVCAVHIGVSVCEVVQRVRGMHCSTQIEVCIYTMHYTEEVYIQELRESGWETWLNKLEHFLDAATTSHKQNGLVTMSIHL